MIISRILLRPILRNTTSLFKRTNTFLGLFSDTKITSSEILKKFEQAINQNTDQSLEVAAKLYAELEVEIENNEERIQLLNEGLENCSASGRSLIEKIEKIKTNINLEKQEINSIDARAEKEIIDCKNYSVSKIAREILDVADSLSSCQKHALEVHGNSDHSVVISIDKATKELRTIFEVYGIEEFDPLGEEFDANKQQALATIPTPEGKKPNTVAGTMRTGFLIKGRLLRSAHVAVHQ